MTARAYHFDARDEVGKLFADYPDLGKRLVVNVVKPDSDGYLINQKITSPNLVIPKNYERRLEQHIIDCACCTATRGTSTAHHPMYGVSVIGLREPDSFHEQIPADQLAHSKAFVLYHEAGHVLLKNGIYKSDNLYDILYSEHLADAFATIRMLQKFDDARKLLQNISWKRAFDSVDTTHASHMTTVVIDRILADSQYYNFRSLTPEKTLVIAEDYAIACMPALEDVDQTVRLFRQKPVRCLPPSAPQRLNPEQRLKCVYAFANAALGSNDNYSFYIGARLCAPALSEETATMLGMPEDIRSRISSQFIKNAESRRLPVLAACIGTNPVAKKPAPSIL